jgi:hypothetical protein
LKPWPFFHGPSQLGWGLSAGSHTPQLPRFAHSLVPLPRRLCASSVSDRRAARWNRQVSRVPLPNGAITSTGETLHRFLRGHYSPVIAPTDSFANPVWLFFPSASSLVQEVFAGCFQPLLPPGSSRRYLCESFLGCLVPYHGGPTECTYLFLPPCHRPSPREVWVGFPLLSANTTSRGGCFRGCRHFFMFRPPSLLVSQVVPTAAHRAAGQPRLLHPGRTCFVASARTGYASRPNTGN